jgi:gliding motility-associated-like protein
MLGGLWAQTTTSFRKDYNISLFDIPINTIEGLTPNTYVFAGFHAFNSSITAVDNVGVTTWSKRFSSGISLYIGDVKKDLALNRYFVCGGVDSGPAFLMFLDANGDLISGRNFSISQATGASFNRVVKTSDGGYLCVGTVTGYDPDGPGPEVQFSPVTHNPPECSSSTTETIQSPLIVKFDASGNHVWHQVFRYYVGSATPANRIYNDASFVDVVEISDGYLAVGSYKVNNVFSVYDTDDSGNSCGDDRTPRDAMIAKFSFAGNIEYHRQIDNPSNSTSQTSKSFSSAAVTAAGLPLISGSDGTGRPMMLMRFAGSGGFAAPTWIRKYGASNLFGLYNPFQAGRFFETNDGNYAVWGFHINTLSFAWSNVLMKMDPSGNLQWQRQYTNGLAVILPHGEQASDDGFIGVSYTLAGTGHNMHLVKTDPDGNTSSDCPASNVSVSNNTPSFTWGTPIYNAWSANTVTNGVFTPTVANITPTETIQCLTAITVCTPPPLADNVSATPNPICAGESTTINASGPGTNVSYNVYDAATGGTNLGEVPVVVSPGTTTTYYIETFNTTDPTCVSTSRVPITVTVNPSPAVNPQSNSPLCVGETLNLTTDAVAGGTYAWTGPNGFTSSDQNPTISNAQLVNGGTYSLTVTAGGCSTGPATVEVIVSETPTSSPSAANTAVCEGQDIELIGNTVPGGSYSWNGPGGFVSSDQNPVINGATSADAGNYSLVISVGSCSSTSQSVTISVNPAPTATAANDGPVCEGNTITLSATGGTSYSWTGPDGFNSNGSPVSVNNATIANGGVYEVTVTDGNGCIATAQTTVVITNGPALSIAGSDVLCNGDTNGSATVTPTGDAPFTYSWSPLGGTDATANNLAPGAYEVTVIDVNGCQSNESVVIGEPDALSLSTSTTSSQCTVDDGSAEVTVSGGTAPYTYSWSSGGNTATETNIGAGVYTVTVTDANGCSEQAQATVQSVNGPTVTLVNSTNISCFGANDGAAEVSATGGTPGYTYSWSPSGGSNATATGLAAGSYVVTVTDDAGCQAFVSVEITEPSALVADVAANDANCGISDGSIALTITGGTPSYSYAWTPNVGNTASASNLAAGDYTISVTDANGCSIVVNQTIAATGFIPIEIVPNNAVIEAGDAVDLEVIIGGGVSNPTIIWSPSEGLSCTTCANPTASPNQTTTYYVTVTTDDGCVSADSVIVFVNQPCGELFVPTIFSPNGDGNNDFLCIYGSCFESFNFSIYSRWGEKVFETGDPSECWDGTFRNKEMNTGVFVYKLVVKIIGEEEERVESGNINLVR